MFLEVARESGTPDGMVEHGEANHSVPPAFPKTTED
jgi:hypothetical protein